jgi:hypothetical protein
MFSLRLGYEVREWWGKSWCGLIREMTLTHNGATETVTLDGIANSVTATYEYVDVDDEVQEGVTAVALNQFSIDRFGLYEKRLETRLTEAEAETRRDTYLAGKAWPTPALTSVRIGKQTAELAQLDIELVGFSYELHARYFDINGEITAGRNTLSELVTFIATQGGFPLGEVQTNNITWSQETEDDALSVLTHICELGGADARPWRWFIDRDRRLH